MIEAEYLSSVFIGIITSSPPGPMWWPQQVEFATAARANRAGSTTPPHFNCHLLWVNSSLSWCRLRCSTWAWRSALHEAIRRRLIQHFKPRPLAECGFPSQPTCPATRAALPPVAPPARHGTARHGTARPPSCRFVQFN